MPFYQLFCISAHYQEYRHIKDLVKMSALHILDKGGVVRKIQFLGTRNLVTRMHRQKQWHYVGDHWHMYFDTSPAVLHELRSRLKTDPRVIRITMINVGNTLDRIGRIPEQTVERPTEPLNTNLGIIANTAAFSGNLSH